MPPAHPGPRSRRARPRGQGRAGQARHRRQPASRGDLTASRASPPSRRSRTASVVDEFVGAQPPAAVERFFDGLVPSEADALGRRGRRGLAAPRRGARAAAAQTPRVAARPPAARRGERRRGARSCSRTQPGDFAAEGLAARIRLERGRRSGPRRRLCRARRGRPRARRRPAHRRRFPRRTAPRTTSAVWSSAILDELGVDHPLARDSSPPAGRRAVLAPGLRDVRRGRDGALVDVEKEVVHELGGALGPLPPEHVADSVE